MTVYKLPNGRWAISGHEDAGNYPSRKHALNMEKNHFGKATVVEEPPVDPPGGEEKKGLLSKIKDAVTGGDNGEETPPTDPPADETPPVEETPLEDETPPVEDPPAEEVTVKDVIAPSSTEEPITTTSTPVEWDGSADNSSDPQV